MIDFDSNDNMLNKGFNVWNDEYFMEAALLCAEKAMKKGDVPVGAVAVKNGMIIARSWNQVELLKDATAHAELLLISSLPQIIGDWRLNDIDIYVTKEPCAMCASAIQQARVSRLVYALADPNNGAVDNGVHLYQNKAINKAPQVSSGVLKLSAQKMLKTFFQKKRKKTDVGKRR